jgi:tetratricopeptide (TPR) repeat protein
MKLGDARKASEFYDQALAIFREIGDRRMEGRTLGNLGIVWALLGDARKAVSYCDEALALARAIGDRKWESGLLLKLAKIYYELGNRDEAILRAEQSVEIFGTVEPAQAEIARELVTKMRGEWLS